LAEGETTSGSTAAQVAAFEVLAERFGRSRLERLPSATIRKVCSTPGSAGWTVALPADYTGRSRELWFVLPGNLPLEPPIVHVCPEAYRKWPHAESDGKFCLWRDGEAPVGHSASDQMREVLIRVSDVISLIYPTFDAPRAQVEFEREWTSYWAACGNRGRSSSTRVLLLDVPPESGLVASTLVSARNGNAFLLVGGSRELRASWCAALGTSEANPPSLDTLVAPLSRPPIGAPEHFGALENLLAGSAPPTSAVQLTTLTARSAAFYVVVHTGTDQPMFAALEITPVPDRRPSAGYQSSRARRHRFDHRKIVSWRVGTTLVERADAPWLRGRGFDAEAQQLSKKHVVIVGCGSLGGLVARALAAGGVGRLSLVDPDYLSTANLGRHVLSAQHLGEAKAKALAYEIISHNPNTRVDAFPVDVARYSLPVGTDLPDLVIGTTGNWPAENWLIHWHSSGQVRHLQLTWTERHALAGHTILATSREDSLASLYDADGWFLRQATSWNGQTYALPGCEGSHQPGTFNRIQRIASLAVEQTIGFLTGAATSEHRAWLGDSATLEKLGGSWTGDWPSTAGVAERTLARPVPARTRAS
jgi:hypothetical protein